MMLLSDTEREATGLDASGGVRVHHSRDRERAIVKSQLKKDMGWLAGFPWRNNKDNTTSIRIPIDELMAAMAEVEGVER